MSDEAFRWLNEGIQKADPTAKQLAFKTALDLLLPDYAGRLATLCKTKEGKQITDANKHLTKAFKQWRKAPGHKLKKDILRLEHHLPWAWKWLQEKVDDDVMDLLRLCVFTEQISQLPAPLSSVLMRRLDGDLVCFVYVNSDLADVSAKRLLYASPPSLESWTDTEQEILKQLKYFGTTCENLASLISLPVPTVRDALLTKKPLRRSGIVSNKRGLGYFRTDFPPWEKPEPQP